MRRDQVLTEIDSRSLVDGGAGHHHDGNIIAAAPFTVMSNKTQHIGAGRRQACGGDGRSRRGEENGTWSADLEPETGSHSWRLRITVVNHPSIELDEIGGAGQ